MRCAVALYQATGDQALAEFGPVAALDETDRARLKDRAAYLLETRMGGLERRVPSDEELRGLMDLVLGVPTRDEHFEVRKKFLAFTPYPFQFERPDGAAPVPEGFEVAIIGAGPAGISMAVQLGRLGIPYVLYDRRSEIGGTWSIHKYPDIRVDTLSITYEFSFDDEYPWAEYFARGEDVRSLPRVHRDEIRCLASTSASSTTSRMRASTRTTSTWQLDLPRTRR